MMMVFVDGDRLSPHLQCDRSHLEIIEDCLTNVLDGANHPTSPIKSSYY
ncbi:hypothetical protein HCU40_06860 [Pseudanabaena biceps]|nr:hypothetical protein [Pseudanabaena biceps]